LSNAESLELKREDSLLVQVSVQSLGLDCESKMPVVILQENEGERVLPIWIGPGEAHAIAMEIAEKKFPRPLTHDLLASVLGGLGGALHKVVISRVEENTYFAEMIIRRNDEVISVDARPSDSIAVALRLEADIFAHEELLERTAIDAPMEPVLGEPHLPEGESDEGMAAEELNEYLRKLAPEDFGRFTP
jgi:bifunctional DNase/RNase